MERTYKIIIIILLVLLIAFIAVINVSTISSSYANDYNKRREEILNNYDNRLTDLETAKKLAKDYIENNTQFEYSINSIFGSMENEDNIITIKVHFTVNENKLTNDYVSFISVKDNEIISVNDYIIEQ